jgi:hypothetical protein
VRNFEKWDFEWKDVELNFEKFGVGERLWRCVVWWDYGGKVGAFV